jgi:hypothetical protein
LGEIELWRLYGIRLDVRCTVREIRDSAQQGSWNGDLVSLELRVTHGGELRLTELYRDRKKLDTRSDELRKVLVDKGWKPSM